MGKVKEGCGGWLRDKFTRFSTAELSNDAFEKLNLQMSCSIWEKEKIALWHLQAFFFTASKEV